MSDNPDDRPETRADAQPAGGEIPLAPPLPQAPAAGGAPIPPVPPLPGPAGLTPGVPPIPTASAPSPVAPPAGGQAFGVPGQTQPTLPLFDGTRGTEPPATVGTAPRKSGAKSGAGKIAGLLVAAALVGGAAGLGGAYAGAQLWPGSTVTGPAAGPPAVTVNDPDSVNATTAIAAKVVPSVVTIDAASRNGGGTGSGVVISDDGYIVTNTHVVTLDGATGDAELRVTTSDGRVLKAKLVGTDPLYDLAVIKVEDATGLQPIEFAASSELNVGDQTVAVGAPLGLSNSVTTGIVSALNRSIEIASSAAPDGEGDEGDSGSPEEDGEGPFYFDFGQGDGQQRQPTESIKITVIQTDAAINPGNSGGALVDKEGKLIGINVAIASAGGGGGQAGNIGVGFAIPSDVVQRIADELQENGEATHGLLGASVQSAAYVDGATITGAYIAELSPGGAAEAGGLEKGDIVTGFNGFPITDSVDLTAQVRAAAAGSKATVTYVRDGKTQEVEVTLGTLEQ